MVVQEFLVFTLILMAGVLPVKPCRAGDVKVKIVPTYTAPSSFSLGPPYYRAASSLSLSCEVEGVEDVSSLVYEWTSTCSGSCFTRGSSRRASTLHGLHSIDSGVHTCMVYDALGCSGTANITIKVVGAGIYLHHGGGQVIPNNSLITTTNPSGRIPRFRCLSGSSTSNVGKLIDPNGKDITKSRSDPFVASNYERGSLVVSNVRPLVAADVGIYTCRIPDENGVSVDVNFGLYLSSISSGPTLTELEESLLSSPSTISCLSRDSPPTDVIWEKDGERIYSNSSSIYQLTQTLVNRKTSTYNNTLTINGTIEDVIGKYCCTASNRLGTSSKLCKSVKAIDISGYESPVIVGLQRDVNCTTFLDVTMMEWVPVGVGEPVERSEDGEQSLILTLNPNTTGLNGATFICRVTTADGGKVFEKSITIKVKELQHTVEIGDIQGCPDAGSNFSLNCTVTSDFVPVIKWLYPNSNQVLTSRNDVWVGPPHTVGNTTTLELRFTPLKTAHGGEYVCVSTISKPLSYKRITKDIKVKITRDGISITRNPSGGQLFTTNRLDLTCTTYLNPAVNTPVSVTHRWEGSSGIITSGTNGRTISSVTRYGNQYSSVLRFSSLHSSDSGNYVCASSVTSQSTSICASGLQTTSTSFSAAIRVTIEISYTPPDQYPDYSPPNYRAASSVTLRCVASGTTGSVSYSWSSTCSSCFASSSSSSSISQNFLTARDAGVHTCSVRDGIGNTGNNRTTMKIVGAGIYISSSASYGGTQAAQPQNSFASIIQRSNYRIKINMYCCTNSTTSRGTFTIPSGSVHSSYYYFDTVHWFFFSIVHHTSGTYAGCTQFDFIYQRSFYLDNSNTGIYTCTRQDSNSNSISVNIGLYREGFRSFPRIYQLEHSNPQNNMLTFLCKTQNAPATDIKWFRDGVRLEVNGNTTQMSTRITSRRSSYTDITLKICDNPENTIGVYTCRVGNKFGSDSETIEIKGLQIHCNSSEYIVGKSVNCSCSSDLDPISIQWFSGSDIYPSQDQDDDNITTSNITVPITTAVRQVYRCSVTSPCGTQQDTITVQNPQVPDDWCRVSVSNLGGENALHLKQHSLLCTVTAIPGMTLPPLVEWVGPDGTVLSSGGNMTVVGSVNTQGSVSTFSLSFNPVLTSDEGTYTCRATVHVPWMSTQPRKISTSFDIPVSTQANIQLKMSPLSHCANWDVRKTQDVESSIRRELENAVRERCDCNFSSRSIFSGEFSCQSTGSLITHVIYRATINGTSRSWSTLRTGVNPGVLSSTMYSV